MARQPAKRRQRRTKAGGRSRRSSVKRSVTLTLTKRQVQAFERRFRRRNDIQFIDDELSELLNERDRLREWVDAARGGEEYFAPGERPDRRLPWDRRLKAQTLSDALAEMHRELELERAWLATAREDEAKEYFRRSSLCSEERKRISSRFHFLLGERRELMKASVARFKDMARDEMAAGASITLALRRAKV